MIEQAVNVHEACLEEYWRQYVELPSETIDDIATDAKQETLQGQFSN